MLDASKVYAFTVKFGAETETLDLEGKVMATSDVRPIAAEIARCCPSSPGRLSRCRPPIRR
jgi:tRNA pseudouridine55 synthase